MRRHIQKETLYEQSYIQGAGQPLFGHADPAPPGRAVPLYGLRHESTSIITNRHPTHRCLDQSGHFDIPHPTEESSSRTVSYGEKESGGVEAHPTQTKKPYLLDVLVLKPDLLLEILPSPQGNTCTTTKEAADMLQANPRESPGNQWRLVRTPKDTGSFKGKNHSLSGTQLKKRQGQFSSERRAPESK